ncbi:Gamma-aminobutyric acid receptor subunit rho-2 [Amphibalanus amphitrite]|uniref:Gamma-aminobutyric acid receptor subunit rho-2 n=1 Tax=Amphibalanus amphitrite TaxID=1232801 RepID=A0A6A4X488_AMPAM|nr:Gamma-aminobutyric acid receptor subunit rho-2 [Amphibalanus amphitrite]
MVLRYQTFFSFAWEDRRLVVPRSARNYSSITLDSDLKERLWLPDIFIFGQEDFEQGRLLQDVGRLHLLTSGHVFLSIYSSYSVGCHLDFSAYPFDVHTCDLIVGSYSQTQEQIEMLWAPRQHAVFEGKALKFNTFSITFQRAGPHTFCIGEGSQSKYRFWKRAPKIVDICPFSSLYYGYVPLTRHHFSAFQGVVAAW